MFSQAAFPFVGRKETYTPVVKGGQTMGVLDKLLGRKPAGVAEPGTATENPPCPHTTLVPRWDSAADMGHEDKIAGYDCDSCKQHFTAGQGRDLRRTEAARLKHTLEA